jgi:hypothetical protein
MEGPWEEGPPWEVLPIELQLQCLSYLRAADLASLERARAFPRSTLTTAIETASASRHPHVHLPSPVTASSLAFAEVVEAMITSMVAVRREQPGGARLVARHFEHRDAR